MKPVKIDLHEVNLATLSGSTPGWLILGENGTIHGMVHSVDGALFTISSTTDPRIQAFGWCPMFDSLAHIQGDLEIALGMSSEAEVEAWLEESRHFDDGNDYEHLH